MTKLAENLKAWRTRPDRPDIFLSQRQVAVGAETTEAYISKLEHGHHEPSDPMLERLAVVFGTTAKELREGPPGEAD